MRTGAKADFNAIPQGGAARQVNPQAALYFDDNLGRTVGYVATLPK